MSELRGKILATIDTKAGTACAFSLHEGEVKVGDMIGLYGENPAMPVAEAKVTDIRYKGSGSVKQIANRTNGQHEHLSALYLAAETVVIVPGLFVGPNARVKATDYGLTDDDIL